MYETRTAIVSVARPDFLSSGWPLSHCCMESFLRPQMCGKFNANKAWTCTSFRKPMHATCIWPRSLDLYVRSLGRNWSAASDFFGSEGDFHSVTLSNHRCTPTIPARTNLTVSLEYHASLLCILKPSSYRKRCLSLNAYHDYYHVYQKPCALHSRSWACYQLI